MTRPNILFFFTDQQRADTCGCYGQKLPLTPELDSLAKEGVRFAQAFTPHPVCGPTRAIIQTGRYATEIGCYRNALALDPSEDTIAKRLNDANYSTGYIGKWHLASTENHPDPQVPDVDHTTSPVPEEWRGGYRDHWLASDVLEFTSHGYDGYMFDSDGAKKHFPEGRYRVDAQTDWILEYLDDQKSDKPFFLFASYIEPHHQNDRNCYEGPHGSKEKWKEYEVPGDLLGEGGDWEENYPDYLGCVNALDQALGRIKNKLKEKGLYDDTIIIFTSDHGSHFRTRNLEYKRSCHDASIHIPLVVSGPGFRGGKVIDELVSLIDLPKTILKVADADLVEGMQGSDLKALIDGKMHCSPYHFFQISESANGRGVRTKRWKYCVESHDKDTFSGQSELYHEAYLYDLEIDPYEKNNLVRSADHVEVRSELQSYLEEAMNKANEPPVKIEPALESA